MLSRAASSASSIRTASSRFCHHVYPIRFVNTARAAPLRLMGPRRSGRGSLPNGNAVTTTESLLPAVPPTAPLMNGTAAPQTSMLHALQHIPPQPMGVPLPHPAEPAEQGVVDNDDLTPPPEEVQPAAEPIKLVIPPIGKAKVEARKGKGKAAPAGNGDMDVDDDLTPPPPEPLIKTTGRRKAKRISYAEDDAPAEEDEAAEQVETTPAKGKRGRGKAAAAAVKKAESEVDSDELREVDEDDEVDEKPVTTPKKRPRKKKADTAPATDGEGADGEEGDEKPTPAKVKKPTPKKSRLTKDEPEYDEDGTEIVKKKRKPKVYPKIEYDIPDVEKKTSTFKGRLGYACLNTVLRATKPDSIFCSRTCRIASIEEEGMELPKGLALMNVRDLKVMIEWNEQNKIRFMRMSSEMFPFASHAKYGYDLAFAAEGLKEAGDLAKQYGHRLTMHPGQFTQLGSPKPNVVEASVRELDYQCEIMDRMGIDQDGVMIIHMGGIYGDKESTLARFKENYTTKLKDNVKRRLVLENDEICYNVDDLLPLCNELEIPIIFDYHHDWINPSSEPPGVLIPKIAETWKKRGIKMKQHLSEPRPGAESVMERRAHADRCQNLPPDLPDDVDLMIEAKDKEQAVFELYRIYDLETVIHDNLRPPDKNPSMHTKGRKSSTKKKTKETGMVDDDGNPVELSDVEKEGDGGVGDEGLVSAREQEPPAEVKAEVDAKPEAATTPKRKRATPAKGKKANGVIGHDQDEEEVKPDVTAGSQAGNADDAQPEATAAAAPPPKKRGRKT